MSSKKRRKKKKEKAAAQKATKSRCEMTSEEYAVLVENGCVRLYEYLTELAGSKMTLHSRDMIARAMGDEFRHRMATDDIFFDRINRFLNSRSVTDSVESSLFFFDVARDLYAQGKIKEVIAARYPDEYRLPENRGSEKRLFRSLQGRYR